MIGWIEHKRGVGPMNKLAWGIISTGRIAGVFAKGVLGSKTGTLVAVGSRTQAAADKFGNDFLDGRQITRHGSYEALLADKNVQAVYIATPHPQHALWAIRAAEAGKHLLVEKPIAMNVAEATAIVEAARRNKVFLMEAFMYRCHPIVSKIVELIRAGAIGQVRAISATFAFNAPPNYEGRILSNALGGGGILDVGCYCASFARLIAGAATGTDVAEPLELKAVGHIGPTGVDEYTSAVLTFPGNIVATLTCGVQCGMENVARVYGSDGSITMASWVQRDTGNKLVLVPTGKPTQEITVDADENVYSLEADVVAHHVARGELQAASPAMTWSDTLGNMKTLDRWRREVGVVYDCEKLRA
jgi:predicted dehydrogenase